MPYLFTTINSNKLSVKFTKQNIETSNAKFSKRQYLS